MIDHSSQSVTLLIIADSESDRVTYSRYLQSDTEKTYQIIEAETLEGGLDLWRSQQPDIVLLDLNLPDGDGLEFLEAVNIDRAGARISVIMLTGQGNEKMAVNAMKLGASDYLLKGDVTPKLLTTSIRQVMRETALLQQLQQLQRSQLSHQAELEERNQLLEKISEELQCTVEELKTITEDQIDQHRILQYEQERYQSLFDFAPDGYLVTDLSGRILKVNQAILELLGINHEFILRKPLAIFVAPAHKDIFYTQLEYQSSSGYVKTTWEITLINRQSGNFSAEITVTLNTNLTDYEPQLFWMIRDISDRKRNERALQQLNQILEAKVRDRTQELWEVNQLLQTVLDAFPLSVFWKDRQSVILGCNQLFAITAGMDSPLEAIGKSNFDFACTEEEALAYIAEDQQIMESGLAKLNVEEKITLVSGEQQWIQTNKIPLRDVEGNVIGVLGTFQDISDRKEAEIQLQKANQELLRATKLKDEFLANMSHELRTPLNSILGLSESLKDEVLGPLNEKQLRAITVVESSGEHLLSLINDILDLSKISSGMVELDKASVSVKNLCDSSLVFVKQQAFNKKIQIRSHIPPHINNINIDERRIKQVLINLLTNAVKFTPNQGNINLLVAIGSGDTWQGEATIPQQLRDINSPMILFQVVDTGIGIAAKDLQMLFQPFVQVDSALNRQYEGTGLGLALVKQIVELHRGQVMVESELGQGSCFTFALPYEMPASNTMFNESAFMSTSTTSSSMELIPDNTPLILLAEDNEANIQTFSSYLTAINYRVIIARNGLEAIAQAKANLPDIILMDIQMPTMDGLEATKQIRLDPNLVNIPIIALTALAMEGDREKCLDAGANEYLAKPIKLRQLTTVIQQFLEQN